MNPREVALSLGLDFDGTGRVSDGVGDVAVDTLTSQGGLTTTRVSAGTLCPDGTDRVVVGDDVEETPASRGDLTLMRATSGTPCPDATDAPMPTLDANALEIPTNPGRHVEAEVPGNRNEASSVEIDDEDTLDEVQKTKKAALKQRVKIRPNPPGSTLSKETSLQRLREKCGISEEIVLVVLSPADRVDTLPPGHLTLFENYFDQCLFWFPLSAFLMRYLATQNTCLAQINPRGIRHLINFYVLSREWGVDISIEYLSSLLDFRVRGRSDELKHSVTNTSGMALIAGFPSKDDHFDDRFFFVEISEKTVEADCIVKPIFPEISTKFVTAMHKELSSGNGNWKKSFSWKKIKRALSVEIISGKILGRGRQRVSSREQVALEAAAAQKATRSSGTDVPKAVVPRPRRPPKTSATSTLLPPPSLTPDEFAMRHRLSAERAHISSGKGKEIDGGTPSKRCIVNTYHATVVERGFGERCCCATDSELSVAKEANAVLQSRLEELTEQKWVLDRDVFSMQKIKKDCDAKLAKLKSRCTKNEDEIALLKK
ncbi:hypothetical protein AALP_AA8G265600 [Arabis alpina]|uniref:Uncharacterized protein n=1 Tax=Arabis alpina TaxID=50452 RepID=A0A087G9L5_ARAAL|nr:hypothetical protein AALP_AA8G265600 [Arabis alpina]